MMASTISAQGLAVSRMPVHTSSRQLSRGVPGQTSRYRLVSRVSPTNIRSRRTSRKLSVVSAMPIGEVAVLPTLIPVLLRAFSAGLLLYSTLQWVSTRSDRKQVERNISEMKSRKAEQKAKLDRLRGTTDTDKKD